MTSKEHVLLTRATEQFADLTNAERKFLHAVIAGDPADYRGATDAENDPNHADAWGEFRTIRAKVIRWMCVDRDAISHVSPNGISINAAKILDQLNLEAVMIPFPLVLTRCAIYSGVNLRVAETHLLSFQGSSIRHLDGIALDAGGARVGGPVFLRRGFHAEGEVRLVGATVDGDLDCGGGAFHNPGKTALRADGMTVKGRAFLRQGFQAAGTVSLISATITGNMDCNGGMFLNTNGNALDAGWAHVGGPVFLGQGFHAEGEVRLVGATISGFLNCEGGAFHNPGKTALRANGINIGSVALLCNLTRSDKGFRAAGTVSLITARVAGDLDCGGGTFHNPDDIAIDISGGQVGGGVFLRWGFRATGEVRLIRTTIGGNLDCGEGVFLNPIKNAQRRHKNDVSNALNADGLHAGGGVFLRWGFHAEDKVSLIGAAIAGDLDCGGGTFHNPGDIALDLARGQVSGAAFLRQEFCAEGEVRLVGATIDGDLDCGGGTFQNPNHMALNLARGQVGGAVIMQGFRAEGMLSLEDASAGQLTDEKDSWPTPGKLRLRGFVYTTIADDPTDANARRVWLERQPATTFSPQPYQQLAKVLRETGHEAAAKRILIAQEKARRKHGELGWLAWGKSMLLGATIAHGYRPSQALLWAVIWVAIGGGLFGWGYDKGIVIPTKAEAYDSNKKIRQEPAFYPAFNRWLYALDTFVPIINFGQKDYWAPQVDCYERIPKGDPKGEERIKTGLIRGHGIRLCVLGILNRPAIRVLYLYRWLHIVAGWVLITLFVTGFTNLVRRQ